MRCPIGRGSHLPDFYPFLQYSPLDGKHSLMEKIVCDAIAGMYLQGYDLVTFSAICKMIKAGKEYNGARVGRDPYIYNATCELIRDGRLINGKLDKFYFGKRFLLGIQLNGEPPALARAKTLGGNTGNYSIPLEMLWTPNCDTRLALQLKYCIVKYITMQYFKQGATSGQIRMSDLYAIVDDTLIGKSRNRYDEARYTVHDILDYYQSQGYITNYRMVLDGRNMKKYYGIAYEVPRFPDWADYENRMFEV